MACALVPDGSGREQVRASTRPVGAGAVQECFTIARSSGRIEGAPVRAPWAAAVAPLPGAAAIAGNAALSMPVLHNAAAALLAAALA